MNKHALFSLVGLMLAVFLLIGCEMPASARELVPLPQNSETTATPATAIAAIVSPSPEGETAGDNQVVAPIATITPGAYTGETGEATATGESVNTSATPDPTPAAAEPTATTASNAAVPTATATQASVSSEVTAVPTALSTLTPTPASAATSAAPIQIGTPPAQQVTHTVAEGENLYRIGLQYGYSWVYLMQVNGLPSADFLQIGQTLIIPGTEPAATATATPTATATTESEGSESESEDEDDLNAQMSESQLHTVLDGENLFRIGLLYNIDWQLIAEANGIVNPTDLRAGQVIKIPTDQPGTLQEIIHVVQEGQTLSLLAVTYGLSIESIAERNDLEEPYTIFIGEQLVIPSR